MNLPSIIIAVDGYSSTGKSTFAKMFAKKYGMLYLDSGALYRAVTLFAQEEHLISRANIISPSLQAELPGLRLHFDKSNRTFIGDRCVETEIRTMEVSSQVSPISALAYVRNYVDSILHSSVGESGAIMDGRDIGTTVFPNAQIKIFMTASEQVRAQRRYDELVAKGQHPSLEDIVANLKERDYMDSHREVSPLVRAADSFLLDNSDMTMEQEISWLEGVIRGKLGILG